MQTEDYGKLEVLLSEIMLISFAVYMHAVLALCLLIGNSPFWLNSTDLSS